MMCGYAVGVLRRGGQGQAAVLDVLGMLDRDRLLAMYYVLPLDRAAGPDADSKTSVSDLAPNCRHVQVDCF